MRLNACLEQPAYERKESAFHTLSANWCSTVDTSVKMQVGQGRGSARQGHSGRGGGGRGGGMPTIGYGGMPGYFYGGWGGYNNYQMPGFYPALPPMRPPNPRGSGGRPYTPLGVQGAGILKRPAASVQGASMQRRTQTRGHGSRAWAGRNRKNLTKEALDADLDEWRMKDKKLGGQSLDAELDEYWSKKEEDGGAEKEELETKDEEFEDDKSTRSAETETPKKKKKKGVIPVLSPGDSDEEKLDDGQISLPGNSPEA